MHRKTAIQWLRTVAEQCPRANALSDEQPLLLAAYAFGDVLEPAATDFDVVEVAFVLDLPAESLPWNVRPPRETGWLNHVFRLDRVPVGWCLRPAEWPVWNHRIRRPLRIWSVDGTDAKALDALARGGAEAHRLPEPSDGEASAQLEVEIACGEAHLRRVKDSYWERGWRSEHRGSGYYPEHHLWDAVAGYVELLDEKRRREGASAAS
ncbi:DUF7711 family protein [Phytoactinopolyspora halotolerans]|uniref:DUF7711 domain-containing protein n=1 Tax=Phytoactinopolyspora halotolerans TaxID=1981512 RepID=A0A6L9S690_9ACTN|nr:hypothetical protein [Phytoactinopolyspora halotolerans]NEE00058.1 hypothetical protein [Phytoactinopolyspora halotolerans]